MTPDPEEIRAKFESGYYSLKGTPSLITMSWNEVLVNKEAPNPNIVDYLEKYKNLELVLDDTNRTLKLTANAYGDWDFVASKIPRAYFPDRLKLQREFIREEFWNEESECIKAKSISLRDAVLAMDVDLSCDMKYYLDNKNELETDLGRSLPVELDLSNEPMLQKLEKELFYKNMCQIFGPANDTDQQEGTEEKSFMIRDFKILFSDGNDKYAVGERDDYYLTFYYGTS